MDLQADVSLLFAYAQRHLFSLHGDLSLLPFKYQTILMQMTLMGWEVLKPELIIIIITSLHSWYVAGPHSLVDKRADS